MNIRQEIACAVKCRLQVPEFKVIGTLEDANIIELLQTPGWEQREDVIINAPDLNVTQHYYFDGSLKHPLISIDDPYVLSGRQGGKIDNNLFTMFPGELKIQDHKEEIVKYLEKEQYKGYISLTFSIFKNGLFYNKIELGVPEDFLQNVLSLYGLSLEWFMSNLENDTLPEPKGISVSCRLYGYPFYPENNLMLIDNMPIPGAYQLSESYAICYHQEKFHIKDAWNNLYKQINDPVYTHNGICYNLDGGYKARKVFDLLKKQKQLI